MCISSSVTGSTLKLRLLKVFHFLSFLWFLLLLFVFRIRKIKLNFPTFPFFCWYFSTFNLNFAFVHRLLYFFWKFYILFCTIFQLNFSRFNFSSSSLFELFPFVIWIIIQITKNGYTRASFFVSKTTVLAFSIWEAELSFNNQQRTLPLQNRY